MPKGAWRWVTIPNAVTALITVPIFVRQSFYAIILLILPTRSTFLKSLFFNELSPRAKHFHHFLYIPNSTSSKQRVKKQILMWKTWKLALLSLICDWDEVKWWCSPSLSFSLSLCLSYLSTSLFFLHTPPQELLIQLRQTYLVVSDLLSFPPNKLCFVTAILC